jgi:hypothetical protein
MKITIEFIDHEDQRYDTPGDWFYTPSGNLIVRISQTEIPEYNNLMAIHELVEALLCAHDGVRQRAVDRFDAAWKPRRLADGTPILECGEDPEAPYHEQHVVAEQVERIAAQAMAVHWPSYAHVIDKIRKKPAGPLSIEIIEADRPE